MRKRCVKRSRIQSCARATKGSVAAASGPACGPGGSRAARLRPRVSEKASANIRAINAALSASRLHVQRWPARRMTLRSEEHTSELQSLMRISYAVFCLKKKKQQKQHL